MLRRSTTRCAHPCGNLAALLLTGAACWGIAGPANAQPAEKDGDWEITLGAGAIYLPDYEGSDDYEIQPFPFISLNYKDTVFIRGPEIGVNLINEGVFGDAGRVKLGPVARYRRGRDENADLRGLGDVDFSIEAGGFARLEYDLWSFQIAATQDVAGGHKGLVADARLGAGYDLTDSLSANFGVSGSWADGKYMRRFFGITPTQATLSGLPAYRAKSGFKDAGADIGLTWRLTDHWAISGQGGYRRLFGDAADSPIVARRGSEDQYFGGVFVSYRF